MSFFKVNFQVMLIEFLDIYESEAHSVQFSHCGKYLADCQPALSDCQYDRLVIYTDGSSQSKVPASANAVATLGEMSISLETGNFLELLSVRTVGQGNPTSATCQLVRV